MDAEAFPGDWVRIHNVLLKPEDRAGDLPPATKTVPLERWLNGFLVAPARLGDEVEVVTLAGRRVRGRLVEVWPCYRHGFGRPQATLQGIGPLLRSLLRQGRDGALPADRT